MKVILLKELKGRGGEGDVIDVADGFANNYLLRQGYAVKATKGTLKELEQRRANIEKREVVRVENANALKEKLAALTLKVQAQVGDEGQLFGSVTNTQIAEALAEQAQVEIDRRRIELGNPIKTAGEHQVEISLYREIKGTVKVLVAASFEEAEEAAEVEQAVEEAAEAVVEEAAPAEEADEAAEAPAEEAPAAEE
ncbi:MAG: 50S ribosomal protein L9 [Coriobacteriia bacterium]|nr:50S ribosomal protein L9 [Coriobacteriia bacterium]